MSNQHAAKNNNKTIPRRTCINVTQMKRKNMIIGRVYRLNSSQELRYCNGIYMVSKQQLGKRIVIGMPSETPLLTAEGWAESVFSK